ncbi:kinesin-like protein KIN-14P isoform X1 [Malus sylvestris]|uniref:kinesin-like protein KIN-14P isoform X1 n=2 Tax=Malus sylvestris TaxID=3752 RepID=UPI0021AC5E0E|nr:kinesin-like protein KIN-14P isoform X1 [Malus sylvestris]XP_050150698.1 kinesin-like protein KIN-14P isoform X1 [Malus sylvestris]XP_050150699.1 kinesin-like protein KIN-14P isoform X1 [Malus sylvestris]XP_050150700.1 kinesin-like protein KIN-14P isoform X1 [Malus sylvestris]
MDSTSNYSRKENVGASSPSVPATGNSFEQVVNRNGETEGKRRAYLVEWLNSLVPNLGLPKNASYEDLRSCLIDGTVLCRMLNRLTPGLVDKNSMSPSENVARFLAAMDALGLPKFDMSDLEKGSMKTVTNCLLTLKAKLMPNVMGDGITITSPTTKSGSQPSRFQLSQLSVDERRKVLSESKFQRALHSPVMAETSPSRMHHVVHKFHEVLQLKQGSYADLPAAKISEMMKPNSLDHLLLQNAPTQSLLSVVNGILDESVERKNGEIPHRVSCLLRRVVQEIERRISTQAEHLRTQNNLFKAREVKYQSRIRVLETLASGTSEESELMMNHLQQIKSERTRMEAKKKTDDEDVNVIRLMKERDQGNLEISGLKQELDIAKKTYDLRCLQMEMEAKGARTELEERIKELERLLAESRSKVKELQANSESKHQSNRAELEERVKELERSLEESRNKVKELEASSESKYQFSKVELEGRIKELERLLADSRNEAKQLATNSESKYKSWSKKLRVYENSMDLQLGSLKELRLSSEFIKQEVLTAEHSYAVDFNHLGVKLQALADTSENYHALLAENRKLFNEIQDLKGNIRVYCRIRPFLPGEKEKKTLVERIGENGELIVADRSKPGKEGNRLFKFNEVYGSDASQGEVYADTQPLIRSVLDGYNVCIFAYGQTGSGKTYTMTGPNGSTKENWGINYRALNDLFDISQRRKSSITYEIRVQMVEIYNEQVHDLLSSDGAQKKLGIMTHSQPNGLAVPDASMHPVEATSDVIRLMGIGFKNRAVGATALNERSSRSHSVVTVHVRGKDLKTGSALIGNLHLVDLAGSERVDRSEVTGDRLKEAQHINKSLSSLGDVIFALAQKSPHVPYRNSKLTQVLQSSLGGQAKTLMFVQLNPDASSFSESLSTLKFAERVAGVELGAAKSNKEGRDVRELMEQVASLKDTIAKKDGEIERLQLLDGHSEKRGTSSFRYESSQPSRVSRGGK